MTDKEILGIDNRVVLGQLFKLAFGTTPIYMPFPIGEPKEVNMSGYQAELKEEPVYKDVARQSIYGTPVVFPIMFRGGTFKKYDDKGKIVDFSMCFYFVRFLASRCNNGGFQQSKEYCKNQCFRL